MKNRLGLFMCSTALVGILYTTGNEVKADQIQNKQTSLQPAKSNQIASVTLSDNAIDLGKQHSEITVTLLDQRNNKILDINKNIKAELKEVTEKVISRHNKNRLSNLVLAVQLKQLNATAMNDVEEQLVLALLFILYETKFFIQWIYKIRTSF